MQLEVYADEDFFDARAGIVATAPGGGQDTRVCVTDDGCLTWTRGHWPQTAIIASGPQLYGWVTNPAAVAAAVVEEVTPRPRRTAPRPRRTAPRPR